MIINTLYKTDIIIDGIKYNSPSQIENYQYSIRLIWRNKNNQFHNENGPAVIVYYPNGNIKHKLWYINGKLHKENSHAFIGYDQNGNVRYKEWWINGEHHNDNGPAFIEYDSNGNITRKEYWKNGRQIK